MKIFWLAMIGIALSSSALSQTMSCPSESEDMMNYFSMGYPSRLANYMGPGNANPIYTTIVPELGDSFATTGFFLWTKSSVGYPWDIKTFDQKYIYDRTTELGWTDPTSFKRFNIDLPVAKRCVQVGQSGQSIKIAKANTNYTSYANCLPTLTQNLGYVLNLVSPPKLVNTGGNLGTIQTRVFSYRYSCDANYANCANKEEFHVAKPYGLVKWQHQSLGANGTYNPPDNVTVFNQIVSGQTTPITTCF